MKEVAHEWIRKAEGDAGTARREGAVKEDPNWDAVCFHAQQAVEKYLKGLLQQGDISFTKTHDLSVLLDLILPRFPDLEVLAEDMERLSAFAVEFRYPGDEATEEDAQSTLSMMERALGLLRKKVQEQ